MLRLLPYFALHALVEVTVAASILIGGYLCYYTAPVDLISYALIGIAAYMLVFDLSTVFRPYERHRPANPPSRRAQRPTDLPPPFPNGWFFLHPSHTLLKGSVAAIDALGQQFAVFRALDGRVGVLDAYCPHMGAHLAIGGTVDPSSGCLRCPFHGWHFDTTGKCRKIGGTTVIPPGSDTRAHVCCERNGGIFLWYHAGGLEPQWELDDLTRTLRSEHYFGGWTTSFINAHIREIPENGADSAHLNVVHRSLVVKWLNAMGLYHMWGATWRPQEKHKSLIRLHQEVAVRSVTVPMTRVTTEIEQWGPGVVSLKIITAFGPVHVFEYITPIVAMQQRAVHMIYCSSTVPAVVGRLVLWALDAQFHRDQPIWERKRLVPRPIVSRADGPILEFRRWWLQFYSPESIDMATEMAREAMLDW